MPRPPGALLLAIATGAGLLTGLSRFCDPLFVAPILVAAAWVVRRHWWWPALPAIALGGVIGVRARTIAEASCAARIAAGEQTLDLQLIDPGAGSGRVTLPGGRCVGEIMVRWPATLDAPAGVQLRVRARWTPRRGWLNHPEGMLLVMTAERRPGGGLSVGPLDRFRTMLARASRRLYGRRAPLVDALVTGRRGELDPELKAAFTASGLVHLLAISGFHIGLLAAWVLLVLRMAGCSRHPAEGVAALAGVGYAAFLGWPAPAARSAVLVVLYAWCRWRQRQPAPTALVGMSLLPLLILLPWSIVDVGAWLSVVALAGLTMTTRWSDRAIGETTWVRAVSASIGASLATAPLTAFVFGQVAPVAVLLGLVAGPLATIIQPAIMLSLALAHAAPSLAGALAASGGLLLQLFEVVVRFGANAPGAAVTETAGWATAWPWLLTLCVALWVMHGRSTAMVATARALKAVTLALWVALLFSFRGGRATAPHGLGLFFLDVGQGDAALVRTPAGHWIAIDAGPANERWDAGTRVVVPFLKRMGAQRLDLLVMSHAHRDHIGGGAAVIQALPTSLVLDPAEPFPDQGYADWLGDVSRSQVRWRRAEAGMSWVVDGVSFRVLHPPSAWPHRGEDLNEDSIVLELRYGDFTALLTGDAGVAAESLYAAEAGQIDLLKVGHHGSRGATSELLLRETAPQVAVVSVGLNNYGHPSPEALARLEQAGVATWRTDHEGTVTVTTDGQAVTIAGNRHTTTFAAHRSAARRPRA